MKVITNQSNKILKNTKTFLKNEFSFIVNSEEINLLDHHGQNQEKIFSKYVLLCYKVRNVWSSKQRWSLWVVGGMVTMATSSPFMALFEEKLCRNNWVARYLKLREEATLDCTILKVKMEHKIPKRNGAIVCVLFFYWKILL